MQFTGKAAISTALALEVVRHVHCWCRLYLITEYADGLARLRVASKKLRCITVATFS